MDGDMKDIKARNALNYLEIKKEFIKIAALARDADIPEGTLRAVLNGHCQLPEHHEEGLVDAVKRLQGGNTCT
jgi:hypothetical protein